MLAFTRNACGPFSRLSWKFLESSGNAHPSVTFQCECGGNRRPAAAGVAPAQIWSVFIARASVPVQSLGFRDSDLVYTPSAPPFPLDDFIPPPPGGCCGAQPPPTTWAPPPPPRAPRHSRVPQITVRSLRWPPSAASPPSLRPPNSEVLRCWCARTQTAPALGDCFRLTHSRDALAPDPFLTGLPAPSARAAHPASSAFHALFLRPVPPEDTWPAGPGSPGLSPRGRL